MPKEDSQQKLLQRMRSAAVAVIGRVREVRKIAATAAATGPGIRRGISEHDPGLAEAVVDVDEDLKGTAPGKELVVRFPTSTDVMWYAYPKFEPGHSGVFILQPDTLVPGTAALTHSAAPPAFNAKQSGDVLPMAEADQARQAAQQLRDKKS